MCYDHFVKVNPPSLHGKTKYVNVVMRNGREYKIRGNSIQDVSTVNLTNHYQWFAATLLNGKSIQIWAEDIIAIYEEEK